jgi:hypothetical protein
MNFPFWSELFIRSAVLLGAGEALRSGVRPSLYEAELLALAKGIGRNHRTSRSAISMAAHSSEFEHWAFFTPGIILIPRLALGLVKAELERSIP